MEICIPILLFAGLGLAAGLLLTAFSARFAVKTDPRIQAITDALPGSNCGGCGFAGCADYAQAIAEGRAPANLCNSGGTQAAEKIGGILGTDVTPAEPMVMTVHCGGVCGATGKLFAYTGTPSCRAASLHFGGDGLCANGCLGFGDCAAVCPTDAICIRDGVALVRSDACIACGKCAKVCPKGILSLRPKGNPVYAACSSESNGKKTQENCKNGCIGCRLCEKNCPNGAVRVQNLHAVIDYTLCTGCGKCAAVCPAKVIRT